MNVPMVEGIEGGARFPLLAAGVSGYLGSLPTCAAPLGYTYIAFKADACQAATAARQFDTGLAKSCPN